MPASALISGISGQDGTYLAELLHGRGLTVVGLCRGEASDRIRMIADARRIDLDDHDAVERLVREVKPVQVYHLAAVHRSSRASDAAMDEDAASLRTNLVSTHALLRAVLRHVPRARVFLAGSCHMFGEAPAPQNEATPFAPTGIYGITKVAAAQLARMYRARDGLFACTGILYNHESPLRDASFVTTTIARGAVEVLNGARKELVLGNLDAEVDWGFAGDYVDAMHRMLEASRPEDYVIATGELHTVRDFARIAFERVGLDWSIYVRQDSSAHRPVARTVYRGDASKIQRELGWSPATSFASLVAMMVDHHRREA